MNRKEFMERLAKLLWNISESEREEALQYYNDYFDDAGIENESRVLEELGSPEQVAQKIKAGLSDAASEFSEQGYQDTRFRNSQEVISQEQAEQERRGEHNPQAGTDIWKIIAIVLLCVLAAPVVLPLGFAVVVAAFSVVVGIAAVCFGIVIAGFAILLSGSVVIGVGVAEIFVTPPVGMALTGVGCLIFALGVLLSLFTIWCCVKILPWLIRGIVGLLSYPFRKAGANK